MKTTLSVGLSLLGLILFSSSAHAELEFCKASVNPLSVAVAFKEGFTWKTRGWLKIQSGKCAQAISEPLTSRYYYFYARRADGTVWTGLQKARIGCINDKRGFIYSQAMGCGGIPGTRRVSFRLIDVVASSSFRRVLVAPNETRVPIAPPPITISPPILPVPPPGPPVPPPGPPVPPEPITDIARACDAISTQLQRPQLRGELVNIGSYTDLLTSPQAKTECTHTYDTGVPDLSTCRLEYDGCASKGPFGICIPGLTNRCTNIIACDTYATYFKTMECDLNFQLKLPDVIDKPLNEVVDQTYQVLESARQQVATALPLVCVSENIRSSVAPQVTPEALANAVAAKVRHEVQDELEQEVREWLAETAITTIAAAVPSGGIGGAAVMSTSLASFVYRVYSVVEPIIEIANDAKELAEDVGFSTSCGWSDWHR